MVEHCVLLLTRFLCVSLEFHAQFPCFTPFPSCFSNLSGIPFLIHNIPLGTTSDFVNIKSRGYVMYLFYWLYLVYRLYIGSMCTLLFYMFCPALPSSHKQQNSHNYRYWSTSLCKRCQWLYPSWRSRCLPLKPREKRDLCLLVCFSSADFRSLLSWSFWRDSVCHPLFLDFILSLLLDLISLKQFLEFIYLS